MPCIFRMVLLVALAGSISACGVKGNLKTPAQIEKEEAKKAKKAQQKREKEEKFIEEDIEEEEKGEGAPESPDAT